MNKPAIVAVHAVPALAPLLTRGRAPGDARVGAGIHAPTAREAGSQFAALLDARPTDAAPASAPVAALVEPATTNLNPPIRAEVLQPHACPSIPSGERIQVHAGHIDNPTQIAALQTPRAQTQPPHSAPPERGRPTDRADAAPRAAPPAMPGTGPTASSSVRQYEGPRVPPRAARSTSAADDIERLIDELAEFVLRQPGARAQSWSVTLWLRAAVLRDTRLTMTGEPGRITISFATDNAASLRRLHAGHEALQARLRERIGVPTLDVTIDATRPEQSHA